MHPLATVGIADGQTVSVVALVSALIEEAWRVRASDIHIDPAACGTSIRLRLDGVLSERHRVPSHVHPELIARVKILSGLRTDEHQAPQDGRFRYAFADGSSVDVRVSIMPTYHGENAVLRLLTGAREAYTLATLGFGETECERIESALGKAGGMLLATGPTGSGKTTTLYTLLGLLSRPEVNIVTVEDPIEYAIDGVRQVPVNPRTGLTFANGLRSLLRQDPDIIMVGEIRDEETAGMAVNIALTGHLLLSTLHTTDAATSIPRLLDMGIEPYLIASTLRLVIAQRLVRRICPLCREAFAPPASALARLPESIRTSASQTWYQGRGFEVCGGTGYTGRTSINEVLAVDDALRTLIGKRASANTIREHARKAGMTTLLQNGMRKADAGETTLEEILRTMHE
jgi:type IV pilus assembly protein PilB